MLTDDCGVEIVRCVYCSRRMRHLEDRDLDGEAVCLDCDEEIDGRLDEVERLDEDSP